MEDSDKCASCQKSGYGKATDDYGHTHCRMCYYTETFARSTPAKGDTWQVYCSATSKPLTAQKYGSSNRDAPGTWALPKDMFRNPCPMIQVAVGGADQKTFLIHETILNTSSAYFARALKSTFKEGQHSRVELAEENPTIFGFLNEYLYTGCTSADLDPGTDNDSMLYFCDLWLLAHYLQMPGLLNYCAWRLLQWRDDMQAKESPILAMMTEELETLYVRAPMGSVLRKFLVDCLVWDVDDLKLSDNAPNMMLRDMVQALKRKCAGKVKNPLLDVRNYYIAEEELVPVVEKKVDVKDGG